MAASWDEMLNISEKGIRKKLQEAIPINYTEYQMFEVPVNALVDMAMPAALSLQDEDVDHSKDISYYYSERSNRF